MREGSHWTKWRWDSQIPACDAKVHGSWGLGVGGESWDPRTNCLSREDQVGEHDLSFGIKIP